MTLKWFSVSNLPDIPGLVFIEALYLNIPNEKDMFHPWLEISALQRLGMERDTSQLYVYKGRKEIVSCNKTVLYRVILLVAKMLF